MRSVFLLSAIIVVCLSACACPADSPDLTVTGAPALSGQPQELTAPTTQTHLAPDSVLSGLIPADAPNTYWVINPASGSRLFVQVLYPRGWDGGLIPVLVLVPGGTGTTDERKASRLAAEGFSVILFDPEGRGRSEGTEDYNGFIGQDGLAAVIQAAASLPGLDPERFGLVSYSYGVTMAAGALARHPDLPIDFFIDWEGPVQREYTSGCNPQPQGHIHWRSCEDDVWWSEREALTFITQVNIPYQRIQSQADHVQPNNQHAIDIVNAAVAGGLPWVRLNAYPPGQTYSASNPPAMLPESTDRQLEKTVAEYAWYIIVSVLRK